MLREVLRQMNQSFSRQEGIESILGGIATMVCQRSRLRKKGNEDLEQQEAGEG